MSMLDNVMELDHPFLQAVAAEEGPLAAERYMSQHNNTCMQYTGFETYLRAIAMAGLPSHMFMAPPPCLSVRDDH